MSLACCDCGREIQRNGQRGRKPKRCRECYLRAEIKRLAGRKRPRKGEGHHAHKCQQCGVTFRSCRKRQPFCSPGCCRKASRRRVFAICSRQKCGAKFETVQSKIEKGRRFCSAECRLQHKQECQPVCHNPKCGKRLGRKVTAREKRIGRDYGKYCCRDCFYDHRWGNGRPARTSTAVEISRASRRALATSLRKKCKVLGVPDDPECTREAVCKRDNWTCQMCGVKCSKQHNGRNRKPLWNAAEHDHMVALTTKGSPGNVFPNSQCLCRRCNNKKRTRSWGQIRLDLEGSVRRWESGARGRRQQSSRYCAATLVAGA